MSKLYCHIDENGKIGKPRALPRCTASSSNYFLKSSNALRKDGWHPANIITPEFDAETYRWTGAYEMVLSEDKLSVDCTKVIEEIPEPTPEETLNRTQMDMISVLDELIDLLTKESIISLTSLSQEAQNVIKARQDTKVA